ncbi:MAG: ABC transporter ATP-binding protein [Candidatus Puniceispirillaceae bacterium]
MSTATKSAKNNGAQPVITLRDIHKSFGDLDVLKGVSLTAHKGEVVSLIGSSGSGKSTLLRCANLLESAESGDVIIENETVRWVENGKKSGTDHAASRMPADGAQLRHIRTNLAMVFQQFHLWAHMTILQNVTEAPVSVLGRDRKEVEDEAIGWLEKVGIADKADFFPSQLSGGQQQRAAIARALAMKPRALLFDEPTSALDPELEQEVVKVIKQLADEGRTMILVTHDMNLAHDVSDRVVFLHQGLIEEEGKPAALFKNPKSERLRQFLSATVTTL